MNTIRFAPRRARRASVILAAVATSCTLAACGSSAATSTATSTSSKAGSTAAATGSSSSRSALVACLQQHGVTPPAHAPGSGGSGSGAHPTPGAGGPAGGNSKLAAAFKACGATGHRPSSSAG
jgi:hypothetical protein